jgi:hypothetical protein
VKGAIRALSLSRVDRGGGGDSQTSRLEFEDIHTQRRCLFRYKQRALGDANNTVEYTR